MARVLAQQWISADGFAAGPGGEGDIFAAVADAAATEVHNRALLPGFGEVLLGRHTYELFAAFWPNADDQPMAATVNAMRRTVASSTLGAAPWGNHAPAAVVPDAAAHVCAATADVIVWGSLTLMRSLLCDGLLSEVELFVAPCSSARAGRCSPRAGPVRTCASTSSRASSSPRASSGCAMPCGPDAGGSE